MIYVHKGVFLSVQGGSKLYASLTKKSGWVSRCPPRWPQVNSDFFLVFFLSCFIFFTLSASAVIRWMVVPGLHERAGEWRWNWRAGKRAGGCRKGNQVLLFSLNSPATVLCLSRVGLTKLWPLADWRVRWFHLGALEPAGREQKKVSYPVDTSVWWLTVISLYEVIQTQNPLRTGSWSIWWNTYVRLWRLKDWTAFLSFHLLLQGEFTFK